MGWGLRKSIQCSCQMYDSALDRQAFSPVLRRRRIGPGFARPAHSFDLDEMQVYRGMLSWPPHTMAMMIIAD
jgi:hypothetical protein